LIRTPETPRSTRSKVHPQSRPCLSDVFERCLLKYILFTPLLNGKQKVDLSFHVSSRHASSHRNSHQSHHVTNTMSSNTNAADSQLTGLFDSPVRANDADQPHTVGPISHQHNGVQHSPTQPGPHSSIFRPRSPRDPFSRLSYLCLAIPAEVEALDLFTYSGYLGYIRTHPAPKHNDGGSDSGTDANTEGQSSRV